MDDVKSAYSGTEFSEILLLSRQKEWERFGRSLNETMEDEFVLDMEMQRKIEDGQFLFPDVEVIRTDKRVLTRQQEYFSAKMHIRESALYFHRHQFVELLYMYKGRCEQFIENLNGRIVLEEGDLFLLNQNVVHGLLQKEETAVLIKLIIPTSLITGEFIRKLDKNSEIYDFWMEAKAGKNDWYHYIHYSGCTGEERVLMEKLMTEYYLGSPYSEAVVESLLHLLLIWPEREGRERMLCKYKLTRSSIDGNKIAEYVYEHSKEITLEELAGVFSFNPSYLSRMIKENCKMSFQELVRESRLEKAAMLLTETTDTVEAIAGRVGYRNAAPIYQGIRQKFGMSPAEYRKYLRKEMQ